MSPSDPATAPEPRKPPNCYLKKGRYWYWEPPRGIAGMKGIALGTDQAAAWRHAEQLNRALHTGGAEPGSVRWLYHKYQAHRFYTRLKESTQKDYDGRWEQLSRLAVGSRTLGEQQAAALTAVHADGAYEDLIKRHGKATAGYCARIARRVWNFGMRHGYVAINPWAGMGIETLPGRDEQWTPAEVLALCEQARKDGKPSIEVATALAYWFGWRPYDVLDVTWSELEARQRDTSKTGIRLPALPEAYPDLAAVLARAPRHDDVPYVVVSERRKKRWSRSGFAHAFREVADAAKIRPELQFRDLRPTALTELDEAGVDAVLAGTHSGHKTLQMRRRYSRRTEEAMREAARMRLEARARSGRK